MGREEFIVGNTYLKKKIHKNTCITEISRMTQYVFSMKAFKDNPKYFNSWVGGPLPVSFFCSSFCFLFLPPYEHKLPGLRWVFSEKVDIIKLHRGTP